MDPFVKDDDTMETGRWNLDDRKLLELIQETVREWQNAERNYLSQDDSHPLREQNYLRVQVLKELYQSLIREAKKRELTLSSEQLINQIISTHQDKHK